MKNLTWKERLVDAFAVITFLPAMVVLMVYIAWIYYLNGKSK